MKEKGKNIFNTLSELICEGLPNCGNISLRMFVSFYLSRFTAFKYNTKMQI